MNKITAEEGKLRITEPQIISIWGHEFTRETFDKLVNSLKQPTFDEVIEAWENIGYKVNFIEQIHEIDVIKNEYTIEIYEDMFYGYRMTLTGEKDPFSINAAELNAINLTIKYLEAQEGKETSNFEKAKAKHEELMKERKK